MGGTRVAIVSVNADERANLEILFAHARGFVLDGSFPTTDLAVTRACESGGPHWDLGILDLQPGEGANDFRAIRHLKSLSPETQIVVLIGAEDPHTILRAIRAGASGYLVKPAVVQEVLEVVHTVLAGGSPMTPGVARAVLKLAPDTAPPGAGQEEGSPPAPPRFEPSEREREVLQHLADGLSATQIAATMQIGLNGIRAHVRHIYRRLQILSVAEAVLRALRGETD